MSGHAVNCQRIKMRDAEEIYNELKKMKDAVQKYMQGKLVEDTKEQAEEEVN